MLCGLDKPGRVAERRPISQGPGDHIILIISLAIKIQTMIVAPSGNTTRPSDASTSSICFITLPPLISFSWYHDLALLLSHLTLTIALELGLLRHTNFVLL